MEADIVERIHALVEDSADEDSPELLSDCCPPFVHFEPLFGNYSDVSPGFSDVDRQIANNESRLSVKLLIPAASVGPLIGKGGFFMRTLQHSCFVNICPREISYPGTNDRVAILKGRFSAVLNVTERISQHIKERCSKAKRHDEYSVEEPGKTYEIRLLVPHSSAGLLIGKNGATVKQIRERTGCVINIYPRSLKLEESFVDERVIVVGHDCISFAKKAVESIFEKIVSDPNHGTEIAKLEHLFVSRSPRRMSAPPLSPTMLDSPFTPQPAYAGAAWNGAGDIPSDAVKNYVSRLVAILRSLSCNETVISEAVDSIKILSSRGILELALSIGMQSFFGATALNSPVPSPTEDKVTENVSVNRAVLEVLMSETGALPDGTNYAAGVIEAVPSVDCLKLKIPERIVGAVIGPKAKTLTDIQHFTRCRVQMERKDPNSSPDGLRTLSLYGDDVAVKRCKALMERLINDEHRRRISKSVA